MLLPILCTFFAVVVHTAAQICQESCQQSALAFAYQYGFPLYAYGRAAQGIPDAKTNTLYRGQALASSNSRSVVRPNVDTLYTEMFYDLSAADLVITIPEFDDRYWLFPFYDLYANNYCNVGSLQGHQPGKYLLRFADNNFGLQTEQINDTYKGYINSPTPYGILLVRIVVRDNTTDVAAVVGFENKTSISVIERSTNLGVPALNLSLFSNVINSNGSLGAKVLKLTANLSSYSESEVLADRSWIAETLANAGISNGTFQQPNGTNLTAAVATANASALSIPTLAGFTQRLGNNWTQGAPQVSGDFHSFYNARHLIAQNGYLQLTAEQAIYPTYTDRTLNVGAQQAYLFTFSTKPDLLPTGFWSLTVYGGDQYLIPNPINQYALGDRSNLTYSNGTHVYGNGNSQGPFQILIQPADVPPPANWTSNWLPAPSGGGDFSVNLRFYGAKETMVDGTWEYPVVTVIDAIAN